MTGVPATTDMHFRNGAVAISYVSTLLLQLVDEKKVSLDDKISKWVPEIPHSDEVTLGQLAQMTSGYVDYVLGNPEVDALLYADPFRQWTPEELLATVTSKPLFYAPGTNWNYAHTNYVILGLALEKITGQDDAGPHAGEGPRPARAEEHDGEQRHAGDPRAGAARVHLRAPRRSWASRRAPGSTRSPRSGTRRGRSPTAPSRRRTSSTSTRRPSPSGRASCCRRSRTRRWSRPTCAARRRRCPAARDLLRPERDLQLRTRHRRDRQLAHAGSAVLG